VSQSVGQQISEINMTPLIDLVFLLLITFVITFPLVQQGIPVNLPKGAAKDIPADRKRTITIDRSGALYLDDVRSTAEKIRAEMTEVGRRAPETTVLVRADEAVSYGKVVAVMKILHDARLTRLALVTQADKRTTP
jgi:biopolymer transport protein TolR